MTSIAVDPDDAPLAGSSCQGIELRKRFVAFAFAAADLLVETDASGTISFALGATTALLGKPADDLTDIHIEELLARADRGVARAMLRRARIKTRIGPIKLRCALDDHLMIASLLRSGEDDRTYWSLASADQARSAEGRSPQSDMSSALDGLIRRQDFEQIIGDQTLSGNLDGLFVSLVQIEALSGVETNASDAMDEPQASLIGMLRCLSIDGSAVTRLAADRFAVLSDQKRATEIERELRATIVESDPDVSPALTHHQLSLETSDIEAKDLIPAIKHVITTFADSPSAKKPARTLAHAMEQRFAATRAKIEAARHTIHRRGFSIVFQPIVDLGTFETSHFEALARLEGNKSPAEFVAFAEEVGLIADFDLAVVETVLQRLCRLRRPGKPPCVAVNVSARSLASDVFVDRIGLMFAKYYEATNYLLFEITETSQLNDLERAERVIQNWRRRGFRVCLDDFGAGAAAFHYIRSLTVDFIKLDGGYVDRHLRSERDASILRAMISLSDDLGVATIAEMIENDAQLASLRRLGADYGQGYLFGSPAPDMVTPCFKTDAIPIKARSRAGSIHAKISPACL